MPVLSLQDVSKHYGEQCALDGLSLDFARGSFTAVIGRSGCGKSTLLEMCNGLAQPDSGRVEVFGHALDYSDLASLRRKIGYAVQGTGLFPHLTVADNITLLATLENWDSPRINRRLEQLLALMQLGPDQLHKYPRQLSGGQQQRAGLCRAMMLAPELLLLDEPFGAIDPLTRADIQHQLQALHKAEPTTTVLVTHDMREAMMLADRIAIMDRGGLVRVEGKDDLLQQYPGVDTQEVLLQLIPEART